MSETATSSTIQFLTYTLGEETFAVDISQVREVLEYTDMTVIPQMPSFMRGVINLRGHVVPVVDLRRKFGMEEGERTVNTCIIIVEVMVGEEGESAVLGALVDSVQEVMNLESDQIEPPPKIGTSLNTEFIRGMGKQGDQFVIILDTDKVFSSDEMALLQAAEKPGQAVTESASG